MTRTLLVNLMALSLLTICIGTPGLQAQSLYTVSINTTGLSGTSGGLAFDFLAGDNATPNNTALITAFATDGTLVPGSHTNTGSATGSLPGTLTLHDSGFSESFQGVVLGNTLSYTLSLTNNFAALGAPDEFSFFLTDPTNTGTVVHTSDPTGADALFVFDLDGSGSGGLTVFAPSTPGVSYSVRPVVASTPEPGTLALATATTIFGSGLLVRRRRSR